ncbi:helix-turn-helix domain-containing protein [Agrobacterium sp. SORGH_AS 787]|uniref:ArsR/SmtB family transcription factor n=1 Tax=Agrobacterium sp. SORGH_AS 787 TaxID=3041775 RepID=UPI0032B7E770
MRAMKHPSVQDVSLEQVFYALSDPVRLEIVQKLCVTDEATCSALDGGRPKSSVSHHFRVLREAGLVRTRNEGVTHMNALRRAELNERFPGLLDLVEALMRSKPASFRGTDGDATRSHL